MSSSLGMCHMMPQFKGLSGGPKTMPNAPMMNDISGQSTQSSAKPGGKSMTAHTSRATMTRKVYKG